MSGLPSVVEIVVVVNFPQLSMSHGQLAISSPKKRIQAASAIYLFQRFSCHFGRLGHIIRSVSQ
jgi:hypothetical protein